MAIPDRIWCDICQREEHKMHIHQRSTSSSSQVLISAQFVDYHWYLNFDDSEFLLSKLDSHDEWRRFNREIN